MVGKSLCGSTRFKEQFFEDKKIQTAWSEEDQRWYFSIKDVVVALVRQPMPKTIL